MSQRPIYMIGWILGLVSSVMATMQDSSTNCPDPEDFPNGYWSTLRSPKTIYYSCNEGFTIVGPSKRLCVEGVGWDPPEIPVCLQGYNCSVPTSFPHGMYSIYNARNTSSIKQPRTIYFFCDDGYHMSGSDKQECLKNGTWEPSQMPVCTAADCGPGPHIPNAWKVSESTRDRGMVTYSCNAGYRLADPQNNKLLCTNMEWVGTWPACVRPDLQGSCDQPKDIRNGKFIAYEPDGLQIDSQSLIGKYTLGQGLKYRCNYGYRLIGESTMRCNYDGWSGSPPVCVYYGSGVKCPPLSKIVNGKCVCETMSDISECAPFYSGQHVECACDNSYKLHGQSILTCKQTGQWDYPMPWCVKGGVIDTTDSRSSTDNTDTNHMSTRTLVIVVATACSVLGVLLLVMVIMVFRRHKPRPPSRFSRASATPPPYSRVHNNSMEELDRYLMIGYENPNDNPQASLPSYEEAMSSNHGRNGNRQQRSPEGQGQVGEYRPLPSIPSSYRANQMMSGENTSRHSIITTSTMNRDGVSELFGSIDTVNVSVSDASTAVTIETLDSATSHHSNVSRRATAGSIASENSNENLATEDAPLLENHSQREDSDKSDSDGNTSDRNE